MRSRKLDQTTLLSIVVPIYNEIDVLEYLFKRLDDVINRLEIETEVLFVNDGSSDGSLNLLFEKAQNDYHYRIIDLSRNFGHQLAVSAALTLVRGDVIAIIDADLQDPPELIEPMLERWKAGVDVVFGKRICREGETWFKLLSAKVFYRLISWAANTEIPENTGDFRLMDRRVVDTLNDMPEHHRFLRGMIAWLGFNQEPFLYERESRKAGHTKYPFKKMLELSLDAFFSFSMKPIRWMVSLGLGMTGLGIFASVFIVIARLLYPGVFVSGVPTILVTIWTFFGFNFLFLGIIGEYVGRTFVNVQGRPNYVIKEVYAFQMDGKEDDNAKVNEEKNLNIPEYNGLWEECVDSPRCMLIY